MMAILVLYLVKISKINITQMSKTEDMLATWHVGTTYLRGVITASQL